MNGRKVISGISWSFAERITAQIVSTIVGIILARILSPEDYGAVSIVMVLITLCNVFVTSGLGTALVQKKEISNTDYNTGFYLSLGIALTLYIVLFLIAPYFADFYRMPILQPVVRVLGLRLILTSVNTIQHAYVQRAMEFKLFFFSTLFGTIASCFVGVFLAYNGFGVWAIVFQYLTNTTIDTIVLLFVCKWRPGLTFSLSSAKKIYSFGSKVLFTQLIYTIEADIRSLIVGKVFGPADLAYYDQGKKYPSLIVTNINASIQTVLLPAFSKSQNNYFELKNELRRSSSVGVFLLAPLLVGFASISFSFVNIVLTDKWLPIVPYIVIFCLSYITRPFETACHQAILAIGRSGLVFWLMIAIDGTGILLILVAVFILKSVLWIALFSLLTTIISVFVFSRSVSSIFSYKVFEQFVDIAPSLFLSLFMGGIVFAVGMLPINRYLLLIIQIIVGIIIYTGFSFSLRLSPMVYLLKQLKPIRRKKNG